MKSVLLPLSICALFLAGAPALAKRMPPPKYKVCNKSKTKSYLATYTYAGTGPDRTSGWRYIKPGTCTDVQADAIHVRGKAKLKGAKAKASNKACVTYQKVFNLRAQDLSDKAFCDGKKGKVVDFFSPKGDFRNPSDIEIR